MAESFYKLSNPEFIIWMKSMLTVVETNNAIANIEVDLITDAKALRVSLQTNLDEKQALDDSVAGKVEEIKFNRKDANQKAAKIQASLKLNSNVPKSLIEQAGFNADEGLRTGIPAFQPLDLLATGNSDGIHNLKWERNGNKYGTMFIIEARKGDSGEWVIVDVVKTAKFEHKDQTPGVKIQYRVRAKRGDSISNPSNVAVIYG